MLYSKFMYQAKELTILQLDNEAWYLDPEWKTVIRQEVVKDLDEIEDCLLDDWWDVENVLRLEVERRNASIDKKKDVIDWLYDLITAQLEPAMLQEETDFVKNVVEFMKVNHEGHGKADQEPLPDNIVPFPTKE